MTKCQKIEYIRPALDGHKVLYKGRRYWVFSVNQDFPFEGEEEYYDMVFWDGLLGVPITGGKIGEDGVIRGSIQYGQGGIDVAGPSIKDFVEDVKATCDWLEREYEKAARMDARPYYNGRRFKIVRGNTLNPPQVGLYVFDKRFDLIVGTARAIEDQKWEGVVINGPFDLPVKGNTLEMFLKDVSKAVKEVMSE